MPDEKQERVAPDAQWLHSIRDSRLQVGRNSAFVKRITGGPMTDTRIEAAREWLESHGITGDYAVKELLAAYADVVARSERQKVWVAAAQVIMDFKDWDNAFVTKDRLIAALRARAAQEREDSSHV